MPFADERLETFATVCDCKSFTKAAEKLSLTQPAVSQHIRKIEEELNVKLFLRRKGDLVLSPEGEVVLLYAKRMRALCQTMLDSVTFSKSGLKKIRIGITHTQESGLMVEVLSRLAGTTDNVSITFITDNITNLYDMLENFEIDVAVIEEKPTKPNLNFVVLATDYLLCVMSPDNPLANQSAVTLAQLKRQHLILRLPSSSTRQKFEATLSSIGESIDSFDIGIEVDSVATIKNLIKKNIGVSVLANSVCLKEVAKHSLVALPVENVSMIRETTVVYHNTFTHPEVIARIAEAYRTISQAIGK